MGEALSGSSRRVSILCNSKLPDLKGCRRFLVISFQAAGGDDPEELFGSQGFRLPVNPESQMAVFFANAERKDLLQMEEAADNVFPLFVVNRFDVAPVILHFFNFPSGL